MGDLNYITFNPPNALWSRAFSVQPTFGTRQGTSSAWGTRLPELGEHYQRHGIYFLTTADQLSKALSNHLRRTTTGKLCYNLGESRYGLFDVHEISCYHESEFSQATVGLQQRDGHPDRIKQRSLDCITRGLILNPSDPH